MLPFRVSATDAIMALCLCGETDVIRREIAYFTVQPAATTLELCSNMLNLPRNMTSSALQLDKCNIETSTAAWRDFQGP